MAAEARQPKLILKLQERAQSEFLTSVHNHLFGELPSVVPYPLSAVFLRVVLVVPMLQSGITEAVPGLR